MADSRTVSILAVGVSAATIVAAAIFWFAGSSDSLAVGMDALATAIGAFWILGIGFMIASTIAVIAIVRGEPRNLPLLVIAAESLIFVVFVVTLALS